MKKRYTINCKVCNKELKVILSRTKGKNKTKFCSRKCKATYYMKTKERHPRWKGGNIEIKCSWCGKPILRSNYEANHHKNFYCSTVCEGKWKSEHIKGKNHPKWTGKIKKICEYCKKEFYVFPYRKNARFCSMECSSKGYSGDKHHCWKGGWVGYYGKNWKTQRKKALKRDNCSCVLCSGETHLNVHHIIPFMEFGFQ